MQRTKWIEVERDLDALLDRLVSISPCVDPHFFNREGVEPNPHASPVPRPKRVFERAYAGQVGPVEFDAVGENLQVVLDFLRSGSSRSKENESS